ncbi:hypothetical protein RRG08_059659 [Elysia crispata]|uniref:Uncharacterized protein n=1 Tax=Elysia crispata TaxID=231223 RepID=A0AAE1B4P8_9GAST|nr:hypothetical protein RRG08_059659 [Elysia crispata]
MESYQRAVGESPARSAKTDAWPLSRQAESNWRVSELSYRSIEPLRRCLHLTASPSSPSSFSSGVTRPEEGKIRKKGARNKKGGGEKRGKD